MNDDRTDKNTSAQDIGDLLGFNDDKSAKKRTEEEIKRLEEELQLAKVRKGKRRPEDEIKRIQEIEYEEPVYQEYMEIKNARLKYLKRKLKKIKLGF